MIGGIVRRAIAELDLQGLPHLGSGITWVRDGRRVLATPHLKAGLVSVILVNGLGFFWPKQLLQVTLEDGRVYLGEQVGYEAIPDPGQDDHLQHHRIQLKVGNRDLYGQDFIWIPEDEILDEEPRQPLRERLRREAHALVQRVGGRVLGPEGAPIFGAFVEARREDNPAGRIVVGDRVVVCADDVRIGAENGDQVRLVF